MLLLMACATPIEPTATSAAKKARMTERERFNDLMTYPRKLQTKAYGAPLPRDKAGRCPPSARKILLTARRSSGINSARSGIAPGLAHSPQKLAARAPQAR